MTYSVYSHSAIGKHAKHLQRIIAFKSKQGQY